MVQRNRVQLVNGNLSLPHQAIDLACNTIIKIIETLQ